MIVRLFISLVMFNLCIFELNGLACVLGFIMHGGNPNQKSFEHEHYSMDFQFNFFSFSPIEWMYWHRSVYLFSNYMNELLICHHRAHQALKTKTLYHI